jgi:tetratricopeptide (TPR) repeat protein
MSLLLDALKKAAQEKQQASSTGNGAEQNPDKDEIELSLDEQDFVEQQGPDPSETDNLSVEPAPELEKTSATTSTISDEALQLLVYKTNKQYRRTQKIIWGGALAAALFMLVLGGVYYYYVMLEEVGALERKHEIAMRLFKSQSAESNRKSLIIENSVQPVQQVAADKSATKATAVVPKTKKAVVSDQSAKVFSIQRTEKRDPVSVLLNKGWHAYSNADYAVGADAYNQVLEREPRNRDALLGIAAIAVKQGEYEQAKAMYSRLLRLDPRDQIAISALSNLDEVTPDLVGETRLKFMIQQQPDAAHLHFALGNFYAKQAKWPEAQNEYFSAWQGSSENADYAFNLAVSLDQLGKHDEARRFYEKSLNLSAGKNISFSVKAVKDRLSKIAVR